MYSDHKRLIFHNGFSHYQAIKEENEQTIDPLYKVLKSFGFILKFFFPSVNRKIYKVIIKRSLSIMVVHTTR